MGGSAFYPTLTTPRMPPAVYQHVLAKVHDTLRKFYAHVGTPIEAPAKVDYGDLDVVVYQTLSGPDQADKTVVAPDDILLELILGAVAFKRDKGSMERHFALPWPAEFQDEATSISSSPELPTALLLPTPPASTSTSPIVSKKYIQLDLNICPSLSIYTWELFRCAHGDFWTIVGSIMRPFGLSIRNTGFCVRIAEVEKINRKFALVHLTDSPDEVWDFLFNGGATTVEKFWRRDAFKDVENMYDFIRAECKFYRPQREKKVDDESIPQDQSEKVEGHQEEEEEVKATPKFQKEERTRVAKRSTFRNWTEEYLPRHSPTDRENDLHGEYATLTRDEVAELVKERFGVAEEFNSKQKTGRRAIGVEKLWADVRQWAALQAVENEKQGEKNGENETDSNRVVKRETEDPLPAKTTHPALAPAFILRTLRRRLSASARDKDDAELDEPQRAYREGRFEEVKAWIEESGMRVAEEKMAENMKKSAVYYRERMMRKEAEEGERERENEKEKEVGEICGGVEKVSISGAGAAAKA